MFDELLNTVRLKISTIRAILQTSDKLREITLPTELIEEIPEKNEWRIYEHCAAVTRLYAIYENFVEDLISRWLQRLPQLVSYYSNLDDIIKNTHREGAGRLLLDLKKNRYQHLSINDVIQGLFYGITQNTEYELTPDSFLLHEQNLRKDELERLFTNAGITNAWRWVTHHRSVKQLVENPLGSEESAETRLNSLIDDRNAAAHRTVVDRILGIEELLELCDFIENLCQALAELVTYKIILKQELIEQVRKIGEITEWLNKSKVVIAKVRDITLSVGDGIFLASETKAHCQLVIIESIQIDDVSKETVEITSETEVGLKFNTDAREGLSLYVETSVS